MRSAVIKTVGALGFFVAMGASWTVAEAYVLGGGDGLDLVSAVRYGITFGYLMIAELALLEYLVASWAPEEHAATAFLVLIAVVSFVIWLFLAYTPVLFSTEERSWLWTFQGLLSQGGALLLPVVGYFGRSMLRIRSRLR